MKPIEIALNEYGTKGVAGILNNAEVVKYFKEIGHGWVKDDETAWCAAFLNWVLKKAGKIHTGALNARSFLTYGVSTKTPQVGDIVVLWRISRNGPYGHCGLFVRQTKNTVFILGGNQLNQVCIQEYSKEYLLDYRQIPLASKAVI